MRGNSYNYLFVIFTMAIIVLANILCYSQQDALTSQYMFNGLSINPAYAGSADALSLTLSARKQWVGMEGAPFTQTFSAHAPVKNERIGVGLIFINDIIGVTNQNTLSGLYSYSIVFDKKRKLSFGLQTSLYQFRSKLSILPTRDMNDNAFLSDINSRIIPSFGTGIYYSTEKFYVGFSCPHLVNNIFKEPSVNGSFLQRRHLIFTGGYVYSLTPGLKIKPSILIKNMAGTPFQLDINANLILKEVLWVGLSYRSYNSINFLTQVQLSNQLRIGYSYDWGIKKLSKITYGSHELILSYNFSFVKGKIVTPRYF